MMMTQYKESRMKHWYTSFHAFLGSVCFVMVMLSVLRNDLCIAQMFDCFDAGLCWQALGDDAKKEAYDLAKVCASDREEVLCLA